MTERIIARQNVRVAVPCPACRHQGLCAIEEQIEENLVLEIASIGRPVTLTLSCSAFSPPLAESRHRMTPEARARISASRLGSKWTPEQRARFHATIAKRRA